MARPAEDKPARVTHNNGSQQAGNTLDRWSWVEPTVWTKRMLTALETGNVKGGVWFRLIDKVWSLRNLSSAFAKVKANAGAAGVDHQTIEMFDRDYETNLQKLHEALRRRRYQPRPVRRVWIPKSGRAKGEKRPLGIPTVRDRVVQAALRHVIEPIFERDFAEHSYGFRPGRGCKDALRRVDALLKAGYTHVVDADLKSYFDTIPHERLMQMVRDKIADGRVLELIESYLKQQVMDGLQQWTPESGSPQGAVLSPLLSNIYLNPLDQLMAAEGIQMVRYADDFVLLCQSELSARKALERVKRWTDENGLTLHPDKTRIVNANEQGFDFLGYRFDRGRRWPRDKSLHKFKDTIRAKTKRTNGSSLQWIITNVNGTTKGWFEYFKHSHRSTFRPLDGWIRMRLRSVLRRRRGGRGHGRGRDHQRWPNAFFTAHGLFDMATAHKAVRQSV
ncbi:MAG: group II intron reverse transcriptase/maturase [Planctomycetota bacterium]